MREPLWLILEQTKPMKTFLSLLIIITYNQFICSQSSWVEVETDISFKLSNIFFVNPDTGFAYGSFESKGEIYKTTNGGRNWNITLTNNNDFFSSIYFLNQDIGWICGSNNGRLVLYKTVNGGESWDLLYANDSIGRPDKLFFSGPEIGWILKIGTDYLLKSIDGGETWDKYYFNISSNSMVDFNFINDTIGFCCYEGIYKTIDGGITWIKKQDKPSYGDFHCLFFNNDSIGYAINVSTGRLYKMIIGDPLGINKSFNPASLKYELKQNYPNPFNLKTNITYYLERSGYVKLSVINNYGHEMEILINNFKETGLHHITWYPKKIPGGIYYYRLIINGITYTKKLILTD